MRIGIVSYWFNRGQATVGRWLRSALSASGYRTFVLARPPRKKFFRGEIIAGNDVWDQAGVTRGKANKIPAEQYLDWARENRLDAVFCDQNYQFEEIRLLRETGVRTIGRFVWESFGPEHVESAKEAFDTIYALTRCEQERYADWGISAPLVRWGCHPELLPYAESSRFEDFTAFYPGGYLSLRKPTGSVLEGFRRAAIPGARLVIKTQRPVRVRDLRIPRDLEEARQWRREPHMEAAASQKELDKYRKWNIFFEMGDLDAEDYYRLFSGCRLCLAPSRWEGLGLHLYEAAAFAMPCICNRMPPLSEVVQDGKNGLLTACRPIGRLANGLDAMEPDTEALAKALKSAREDYEALVEGARLRREELSWEKTQSDLLSLAAGVETKD